MPNVIQIPECLQLLNVLWLIYIDCLSVLTVNFAGADEPCSQAKEWREPVHWRCVCQQDCLKGGVEPSI